MARQRQAWERIQTVTHSGLATYVNGAQHDAWLLHHEREDDRFTLTATDENTVMLAEWGFGIPYRECLFPFSLVFEGVSYVVWRLVDRESALRWCAPPVFRRGKYIDWLNDTFIKPEQPGAQWALQYFEWHETHSYRVLLVEARSVRIVQRQREAWARIVGEDSLPVFDEAQAVRREFSLIPPGNLEAFCRKHGLPGRNGHEGRR
ncbi:hypothetical protein BH11ARM2_BH11ARM2_22280 [soil metagenome]